MAYDPLPFPPPTSYSPLTSTHVTFYSSPSGRRYSLDAAERRREGEGVTVTHRPGDGGDLHGGRLQQGGRPCHAQLGHVFHRRSTRVPDAQPAEVFCAHARAARESVEGPRRGQVGRHRRPQLPQRVSFVVRVHDAGGLRLDERRPPIQHERLGRSHGLLVQAFDARPKATRVGVHEPGPVPADHRQVARLRSLVHDPAEPPAPTADRSERVRGNRRGEVRQPGPARPPSVIDQDLALATEAHQQVLKARPNPDHQVVAARVRQPRQADLRLAQRGTRLRSDDALRRVIPNDVCMDKVFDDLAHGPQDVTGAYYP